MAMQQHYRQPDIVAFKTAAKQYSVYIIVRRTNIASVRYMGLAGYTPKRIDCKAKTADRDAIVPGVGVKKTAGLVVDPNLPGFETAYATPEKRRSALKEWKKFESKYLPATAVTGPAAAGRYHYIPGGLLYCVQLDQSHQHYGCVMFSSSSLITAAKYVHGDYDLYDIVPASDTRQNVVWKSVLHGQPAHRGPEFFDTQHLLNRKMEMPGVLHGSQAKFAPDHTDEDVDVFYPDGQTVTSLLGKPEIVRFYDATLGGRKTYGQA